MKKLRVLVLVHDVLVPPPDAAQLPWQETWAYQMELDVETALKQLGHDVEVLGVAGELKPIRERIEQWRPHIVFNILTDFHGITAYEAFIVSYLELLKQPYTGCNPRGILLANDKALSKQILGWHGIPTPPFAVFTGATKKPRLPTGVEYPVIVKSAMEHGSTGISQASVCTSDAQLERRVDYMRRKVGGDILAEHYIEGRELTVSIIGHGRLEVLPVWEVWYENLPETRRPIATEQIKWDVEHAQGLGIKTGPARELPPKVQKHVQKIARDAYVALGLSGYGRIDLRMDAAGNVYVIEANVNPDLTAIEDFSEAARAVGHDYPQLIQRIVEAGLRYRPPWKHGPSKKYS